MAEGYEERAHKQIQIESWSNSARTLFLRGATTGGPFAEQHVTNADRSRATDTFELHGVPTKLQISPSAAPVRRGECYVRVTLLMDGEPVLRLSAGYLTDSKTMSWPPGVFEGFTEGPGLILNVSGANPAAGAEIAVSCPANARWKVLAVYASLLTDATVTDRTVRLLLDDGTNTIFVDLPGPAHAASLTRVYTYFADYPLPETAFDTAAYLRRPVPKSVVLFQGYRIATVTGNLQAGDDWAAPRVLVEEWIEE